MLPQLQKIPWKNREVRILFDSDVVIKDTMMAAKKRLWETLKKEEARIRIVQLTLRVDESVGMNHPRNSF